MNTANKPSAESWQAIKLAYLAGADVPALAAQHGITEACLRKRITRQGWATEKRELAVTVTEQTIETCRIAAKKFKQQMCGEFDEWFELAARQRSKIKDGDFEAFNVVVNGFAKLHGAAFKHYDLERHPEQPLIIAGLLTACEEWENEPIGG